MATYSNPIKISASTGVSTVLAHAGAQTTIAVGYTVPAGKYALITTAFTVTTGGVWNSWAIKFDTGSGNLGTLYSSVTMGETVKVTNAPVYLTAGCRVWYEAVSGAAANGSIGFQYIEFSNNV